LKGLVSRTEIGLAENDGAFAKRRRLFEAFASEALGAEIAIGAPTRRLVFVR
jgi:hypothetical protein